MPDVYGSVAGFQTYHQERGRDITDYDDGEITAALTVASEWIDATYKAGWPGIKVGFREQIRDWPRTGGFDINGDNISSDSVPIEVEYATYEAALRQLQSPGSLSVDFKSSKYTSVAIEGAVRVTYADRSATDVQLQIMSVDQILYPILTGYGSVSGLSGATSRV